MLEFERGRADAAARAWRKAETIATTMEIEYDAARARLETVRHGFAGPDRDAQRIEALQALERLGAGHHLRIGRAIG
jgi:hypothetical protein